MKNSIKEVRVNEFMKDLALFASKVAETDVYGWDKEFRAEYIHKYLETLQKRFCDAIPINDLNKEQLAKLGFIDMMVPYTAKPENRFEIMLVPLYILPTLKNGTELICIDGRKCIVGKDNIDTDVRLGCVAYGIKAKED